MILKREFLPRIHTPFQKLVRTCFDIGLIFGLIETRFLGPSLQDVRLELLREEQERERAGRLLDDDEEELDVEENVGVAAGKSQTEFMYMLIELEDAQCVLFRDWTVTELQLIKLYRRLLAQDSKDKRSPTAKEIADFTERRTRLLRNINRLRVNQNAHSPGALQFLASIPPPVDDKGNPLPPLDAEYIPLLPPSQLPAAIQLPPYTSAGLKDVERRLRDAQCCKALNELRHNLIVQ